MDSPVMVDRYGASLSFYADYRLGSLHEWMDVVSFSAVRFPSRTFKAVIGMEVLMGGKLTIENQGQAIRFEYS